MNIYTVNRQQKFVDKYNYYWPWVAIAIVIMFAVAVRIPLIDVPLERDEGEYAYAGQLILQGIPPYAEVYNMKMPGIYAAYALIMAFLGQTHSAIHMGLIVVNSATILLLFLLGRKLFTDFIGVTTAASFAILSLGQPVQGIFANAEHFVIFTAVGGILLLVYSADSKKWFTLMASAILLGLGFTMKQHGAAFIVFGGIYLFFCEIKCKPLKWNSRIIRVIIFLFGACLPFIVTCLILWQSGVFDKFWFWTFDYAREYVSSVTLPTGLTIFKDNITKIISSTLLIWILSGIGLTSLLWNEKSRGHALFVAGFFVFSFLAICPGFYFRPHYFILFLPAIALLSGMGAGAMLDLCDRGKSVVATRIILSILVLAMLFHGVWKQRSFLFDMSPTMASRTTYGLNPFPESLEIARFLKEHSGPGDRIAVLGSEPQIYFYSNRRSATGYIYTYALMEIHSYALQMQEEMIREIESARPEFLIFANIPTSWIVRPRSEKMIFNWFQDYSGKYYDLAGIVDIKGLNETIYLWNQDVAGYLPKSRNWLSIYRRRS